MAAITLAEVETKIKALLDSPQVDYTIGKKRVSASQKLDQLLKVRGILLKEESASLVFIHFPTELNELGLTQAESQD